MVRFADSNIHSRLPTGLAQAHNSNPIPACDTFNAVVHLVSGCVCLNLSWEREAPAVNEVPFETEGIRNLHSLTDCFCGGGSPCNVLTVCFYEGKDD